MFDLVPGTKEYAERDLTDGYNGLLVDLDKVEFDKDINESFKLLIIVAQAYYYGTEFALFSDYTYDFLCLRLEERTGLRWRDGGSEWHPRGRTRRNIHIALTTLDRYQQEDQGLQFVLVGRSEFETWTLYDPSTKHYPRYAYEPKPTSHKSRAEQHNFKRKCHHGYGSIHP